MPLYISVPLPGPFRWTRRIRATRHKRATRNRHRSRWGRPLYWLTGIALLEAAAWLLIGTAWLLVTLTWRVILMLAARTTGSRTSQARARRPAAD